MALRGRASSLLLLWSAGPPSSSLFGIGTGPLGSCSAAIATTSAPLAACGALFRQISSSRGVGAPVHIEDDPYCRQRQQIALGNRVPTLAPDTWLSPSAVVIGDVDLYDRVSVWHGAVLRGDLNHIRVHAFSNIQDKTTIHAARSSPTGLSAATYIGQYVTVGQGCVLRSVSIGNQCVVGDKCIMMEGSVMEDSSILAPGSVVPPGHLIPSGQLWSGVPARFVRDLSTDEKAEIQVLAESVYPLVDAYRNDEFPISMAYKEAQQLRKLLAEQSPEYKAILEEGWAGADTEQKESALVVG